MTLRCHARGYPDPTFLWIMPDDEFVNASSHILEFELLDDDTKKTRGKILQKDGSLLVFNTRVHDSGIYKCLAVNVAGRDEKSVNLTVNKGKSKMTETFVFNLSRGYDKPVRFRFSSSIKRKLMSTFRNPRL